MRRRLLELGLLLAAIAVIGSNLRGAGDGPSAGPEIPRVTLDGVAPGMSPAEVLAILGEPRSLGWRGGLPVFEYYRDGYKDFRAAWFKAGRVAGCCGSKLQMSGHKLLLDALGPSEPLDSQSHWWPAFGVVTLDEEPQGPTVYLRPTTPAQYSSEPWLGGWEEWKSDGICLGAHRSTLSRQRPRRQDAHTDVFPSGLIARYSESGWVVSLEGGKAISSRFGISTNEWAVRFKLGEVPVGYVAPRPDGWSYPDAHTAVLMRSNRPVRLVLEAHEPELFQALDEAAGK